MVRYFVPGVDLVSGEVIVEGGGLLGRLEALESTGIQMMASGLMNNSFPITCNGANLAYRPGMVMSGASSQAVDPSRMAGSL